MTPEQQFWQQEATIRHAIWRNHVITGFTKRGLFPWLWRRKEARLHRQCQVAELRFQRALENAYMR